MKTLLTKSLIFFYFVLSLIFSLDNLYSQTAPKLSDLNICFAGDVISIASFCDENITEECNGFLVYKNDEYFDWVNSYNFINFAENKGRMVELIKYDDAYHPESPNYYKRSVINLNTGAFIIPFSVQDLEYNYSDVLFIVNSEDSSYLVNTLGEKLTQKQYSQIKYHSDLGYYDASLYDEEEIIFDKNENIIRSFGEYNILDVLDNGNFIAAIFEDGIKIPIIIDNNLKVLFKDDCMPEIYLRSGMLGSSFVQAYGLCHQNDDITVLLSKGKGKWYDPLIKFSKNSYVTHAELIPENFENLLINGKYPKFYVHSEILEGDDYKNIGVFLDKSTKVILSLEDAPFIVGFHTYSSFVFIRTAKGTENYLVYDTDGKKILPHDDNYIYTLDETIEHKGYYCFVNPTFQEGYIYHLPSKKLVTLKNEELEHLKNIEDLEKFF
jgi:hypothetical protein